MRYLTIFAMLIGVLMFSEESSASCSVMKKVNGVLKEIPVACEMLDRPMPCSKETTLPNGSRLIEDVQCKPGEQKTMQQIEREEAIAQKKACGKDYQNLRVGMRLERFEKCVDGAAFVTETVTRGAVLETYRSTFYWLQVRDGRIVAITRR